MIILKRKSFVALAMCLSIGLVASACGSSSGKASQASSHVSHSHVTLTLWQNYGTEDEATATKMLIQKFESLHPGITIKDVAEPANNYFSLLQAAAISHTGPSLAVMWTGLFTLRYDGYLENLKQYVPAKDVANMQGMKWVAPDFNTSKGYYVIPLEDQFYNGFYNKALFREVGLATPPKNWSQLYSDCQLFKEHHITCLYYGSGSQSLGSEFYPWYDLSYMMIGAGFSIKQWQELYSGEISWTSPTIVSQFRNWQKLYKDGYTNKNVVTAVGSLIAFEKGGAAMLIKGNWDASVLEKVMGNNLGVFVPPFTNTSMRGVVQFPGDGYSMTSYAPHKKQAAEFLRFLTTRTAAEVEAKAGLIPDLLGFKVSNPVNSALLAFSAKDGMERYPMLDNVTASGVVTAGSSVMPAFLAGQMSAQEAASKMEAAWKALPASERGNTWGTFKV